MSSASSLCDSRRGPEAQPLLPTLTKGPWELVGLGPAPPPPHEVLLFLLENRE